MNADLAYLQSLMGQGDDINKTLTTASGFSGINLEPQAKLMLPLYAGLRNRIMVDKPKQGGAQAIWKMQLGYGAFDFAGSMGTANGGVGNDATGTAISIQADYKSQSVKGNTQLQAIDQSMGFDDPLAVESNRTLSILVRLEELIILGGNSAAISAPVPVGAQSTATAINTFAAGTWTVKVTALTLQGCISNAISNSNVGESLPGSVDIVVAAGDADFLDVSWPAVDGALGYKVYCESGVAVGDARLVPLANMRYKLDLATFGAAMVMPAGQTFIGVNHIQIITVPLVGQPTAPVADATVNANVFEGLVSWAQKRTIYGQDIGSAHIAVDMDGAALTTGAAGVDEFDTMLRLFWIQWQLNPSLIVTSPLGASKLTNQLVSANGGFMYRVDISSERGGLTGGVFVGGYLNKYVASMTGQGGAIIPVWAHPYMPDGTYLFLSERIPYQYSRESRGFALDVQRPYTYFELGRTDLGFPFANMFTETLKCYHPLAQGSIRGARVQ